MDYLFMIELNGQTSDLSQLKRDIRSHGEEIAYLEIDEQNRGLVGIVIFAESKTDVDQAAFFDKVRGYVAEINHLPADKVKSETLTQQDIPPGTPAIWVRASMGAVLGGFAVKGYLDPNSGENSYQIVLDKSKGGIGGKHSGGI